MKEAWKECKLGEVCENIYSDGTPATMIKEYWNGELPWLSSGETGQRYINFTEKTITKLGVEKSSTRLANKNSTVVASAGQGYTRGQASYLNIDTYVNQSIIVLKPNIKFIDAKFLYFNIDNRYDELRQLSDGTSTRGSLSGKIMKELTIILPPLATQQKIAKILSSLDDKIELNNKINDNLEQQAQTIFKSWFVDFEPFGGKMPDGWRVGKLSEIGTIVGESTPSKNKSEYYTQNGIAWITPKDLSNNKSKFISHGEIDITELGFENSSAVKMPAGTVLYSSRAPIGYIAIAKNEVTTNQGFKSVIANKNIGNAYVYYFLKSNFELIDNMASGSTFKEISGTAMKNVPLLIPDEKTLLEFQSFSSGIFDEQEKLEEENRNLASLRDTLLPKLMNGEIEMDEVNV